jgi:hypothetical protein
VAQPEALPAVIARERLVRRSLGEGGSDRGDLQTGIWRLLRFARNDEGKAVGGVGNRNAVVPAKAGTQPSEPRWIPAFAGMTEMSGGAATVPGSFCGNAEARPDGLKDVFG